ncbi:hypothetical protein Slin15195_G045420 [Septoria linicola]|uniref:Uncharacterized protein n=1 Tax=Septoria linicola TaxID=215465 RepID=A0A9Q9ASA9_9PEZI|nr:hypothetical protein Slin14017_G048940 [Septoria linicola]USW51223.1 hypothetical protein Slin15195_G045420 [Septoria linicola]
MASIRKWFTFTTPVIGVGSKTKDTMNRDQMPRPPRESVMALLDRLQYVGGDLLSIHANEHDIQPIFVQEGLLRLVFRDSTWFKHTMECMPTNRLVLNVQRDVLAVFMYYVFHGRVPGLHEVGQYAIIPSQDDEDDYHTLLVLTWVFAESVELSSLQNALMAKLFDGFDNPAKNLTSETLQICLLVSESGTKMRSALIEYALWLEKQHNPGNDGCEPTSQSRLQPYVDLAEIKSIEKDLKEARAVWSIANSEEESACRRKKPLAKSYFLPDLSERGLA